MYVQCVNLHMYTMEMYYKYAYLCIHVFSICSKCSKDSGGTGKYKLVEHKENFIMESNSCLPDNIKEHYPVPTGSTTKPQLNENHIINGLHDTSLSDDAREAFFQARNVGLDRYAAGIKPALTEDGTQPIKIFPDYTKNATIEDIFVPSTMSCNETIPYGPEMYASFSNASNNAIAPPVSYPLSRISSSTGSSVAVAAEAVDHNCHSQIQASYSSSSGYQSSPNMVSTSTNRNPLDTFLPQHLNDTKFDELIEALSSVPPVQTEPVKKSLNQSGSAIDGIIDELQVDSLQNNGDAFPDLPTYDQPFYHNHNGN